MLSGGGFQAIPKGQFEAGKALGLNYWSILGRIVLPQVFRHALPRTINMIVVTARVLKTIVEPSSICIFTWRPSTRVGRPA
ncbi:ABC transporter permease subunit [uncultured Roseobacter sp.]|uniref:ABC transporter permease subunit n=1 Tax=uncultured Roseobacter sp. TaxID=114847 RepID=UPI00261680B4|nr:ABC transporter permease subunit [uncultured Roseobacter sp.]